MMDFHKGRWRLALGRLVNLRYINRWIIFSADLFVSLSVSLLGVLGMFSILHIRIGESDVLKVGLSSFVASIVSFLLFKAYHGVIRHSTLRGLWRIGGAAIGKSLLMFLLLWLLKARFSPPIYWLGGIMDSTLTIVMLVTLRVFVINVYNSVLLQLGKKRKRVLVFGTEEESVMIATSANRQVFMQNYSIMGFLSFGNSKKSIRIAELPVYQIENVEDLYRLIPRNSLDGVLFPNIKVAHQERDRLIRYCEQASLKTLVVPEMEELRGGEAKRSVREIRIEDLLGREEIHINLDEIGNLLEGKTVLVTGAAGSIGSEICRQLAHFPIKKLVCFDSFSEQTASGAMSAVTTVFLRCFARYIRLSAMGRASPMGMPTAITPPMLAETCIFSNSGRWAAKRRLLMSLSLRTKASAEMSGRMSSSSSPPYRTSISVERMQRWMMDVMSRSAASPAEWP